MKEDHIGQKTESGVGHLCESPQGDRPSDTAVNGLAR